MNTKNVDPQIQQTTPLPQTSQPVSPETGSATRISPIIILILLFVFPPLAWYFMWKESRYHKWFPFLLLFYSVVFLLFLGTLNLLIYPQLSTLYQSLDIPETNSWIRYISYFLMALVVSQIAFSIILFRKLKTKPILPKNLLVLTMVFLALYYLAAPVYSVIAQLSVVTPIYNLTNSFNDYSLSPTPTSGSIVKWKTYQNNEYKFSVDYPTDWTFSEEPRTDSPLLRAIYFGPEFLSPTPVNPNWGFITVLIYKWDKSLDTFIDTQLCDSPGNCAPSKDAVDTTVAGVAAKKIINRPSPVPSELVIFKNSGYIFGIDIVLDKSYEEEYSETEKREVYEKILSTFKFLDQENEISLPESLNNFPIYPNAKFLKKTVIPECDGPTSGFSICNATTYEWETTDLGSTVEAWYKNPENNLGWDCLNAGAGDIFAENDFYKFSGCSKDNMHFTFILEARPEKTTITVGVPRY